MERAFLRKKCLGCGTWFRPALRCFKRQNYCSKAGCRKASRAASQRKWLAKPGNGEVWKGWAHVFRVQEWRKAHPGYWRRTKRRRGVRYKM